MQQLAATPLGQKADLSVTATADDGQVQVHKNAPLSALLHSSGNGKPLCDPDLMELL